MNTESTITMSTSGEIRRFIADTFFTESFSDHDSFLQTGIIDSNGMMVLVVFVEEQFRVKVEDSELLPENLDSIENLTRFIELKQTGPQQA